MSLWLELKNSSGWATLKASFESELENLRGRLLMLALDSSDPRVRQVAAQISAIDAVLSRPDDEIESAKERMDREAEWRPEE